MSDSTQVSTARAITVPFHGMEIALVEHEGQPFTPMKALVSSMGLSWSGQFEKMKENAARWGIRNIRTPSEGGEQEVVGLPLRKLPGWLATLEPKKMKSAETAAKVVMFQNECDDVLWQYWNEGVAINPRVLYSVNPGDKLTAEEAESLRLMLKTAADRQPKAKQAAVMVQGWSKLKAHFKVGYREIPRHEFSEAVSIIARHAAEWELVDESPAPSALPRLRLHVSPPATRTYKFNSANPYPCDGRTIEVAKSIAADIRNWSDTLPACPARDDLHDAAQTLYDLLVSGWTEVDEALGKMKVAMHYLNRWQGRGGGVGNARC